MAAIDVPVPKIEAHIRAGGHPANVASAMMIAKAAGETLSWDTAAGLDLHGDVVAEVTRMLRASGKIPPENQARSATMAR